MSTAETEATQAPGAFMASLVRNNKTIRDDRAAAIFEDAEMLYKRKVEDLRTRLKRMIRERDNMLDMSPSDKNTIISATDFKGDEFVANDHALSVSIRNLSIEVDVAEARYRTLFGDGGTE